MMVSVPPSVEALLEALQNAGFRACPVGGCVRDSLLGKVPHDWDVATSAKPQEVEAALPGFSCIETGIRHGTVTVLSQGHPIEVTTFRIDGVYSDHRRPDHVQFTDQLALDLQRRDFTINAMAWEHGQVIDLFGGRADLQAGVLRCVGEPEVRFEEDGLRILRALRFASVLDFCIEEKTAQAIHQQRDLLRKIAAERLYAELQKLLCGPAVGRILRTFSDVCFTMLPQLAPLASCLQHTPYHDCDAWEHTVRAVEAAPPDPLLRLTMLLHDAGKPVCRSTDADGIDHFYGHEKESAKMAREIVRFLRLPTKEARTVIQAVERHMLPMSPSRPLLQRRLRQFGPDFCKFLLQVQRADTKAQPSHLHFRLEQIAESEAIIDTLLEENACFSLSQLAVRGGDLLACGLSGPAVGKALDALLQAVVEGNCPNEKQALLSFWKTHLSS